MNIMLGTDTLFEEIGYFWGMSARKFSALPEKEKRRYEELESQIVEFETIMGNNRGIVQ